MRVRALELPNLIDEFCLRPLEFAAFIRISSRFNAEEMMVIDADKPNTLCNSCRWTDETNLRLQIVDNSSTHLHVENIALVTQLDDCRPCESVQQYSVLHYVNSTKMTSKNKIGIFCISDVELVKPENAFQPFLSAELTRKEEALKQFRSTSAQLSRS